MYVYICRHDAGSDQKHLLEWPYVDPYLNSSLNTAMNPFSAYSSVLQKHSVKPVCGSSHQGESVY